MEWYDKRSKTNMIVRLTFGSSLVLPEKGVFSLWYQIR